MLQPLQQPATRTIARQATRPALRRPAAPWAAWFRASRVRTPRDLPRTVYHGTRGAIDFNIFSVDGPPFDERTGEPLLTGSGGDATAYLGAHFAETPGAANYFAEGRGHTRSRFLGEGAAGPRVIPAWLSVQRPKVFSDEQDLRDELYAVTLPGYDEEMLHLWLYKETEMAEGEQDEETLFARYEAEEDFRIHTNAALSEAAEIAAEIAHTYRALLIEAGYDGIRYDNEVEGGVAWVVFDPAQIKSPWAATFDPGQTDFLA